MLRATALWVAMAVGSVLGGPQPASAQAADDAAQDDALRLLWQTVDNRWNARDATRFSEIFTADGSFDFVDRGETLAGREAILNHFTELFPQIAAGVRHHTHVERIRAFTPDVHAVEGRVEILRGAAESSAPPTVLRAFTIFAVMLRTEEGWRINALRAYQLPVESASG